MSTREFKSSEETLEFLNIEDPIELQRNLNFALTEETALEIQAAIRQTHQDLTAGVPLVQVLFSFRMSSESSAGTLRFLGWLLGHSRPGKNTLPMFPLPKKIPELQGIIETSGFCIAHILSDALVERAFASQADLQTASESLMAEC